MRKGVTNFELVNLASAYGLSLPLSHIVMRDELDVLPKKGDWNAILNIQSSTEGGGTHWTALLKRGKQCFHFDSFGMSPDSNVLRFCVTRKLKLSSNRFIIQHIKSSMCGIFCIGLMRYVKKKPAATAAPRMYKNELVEQCNNYINLFVADRSKNDAILRRYMRQG